MKELSRDEAMRADCTAAIVSIRNSGGPAKSGSASALAAAPGIVTVHVGGFVAPVDPFQ